jgi:hypothetical protein
MRRSLRGLAYATIITLCYYLYSITCDDEEIDTESGYNNAFDGNETRISESTERELSGFLRTEPGQQFLTRPADILKIHIRAEMGGCDLAKTMPTYQVNAGELAKITLGKPLKLPSELLKTHILTEMGGSDLAKTMPTHSVHGSEVVKIKLDKKPTKLTAEHNLDARKKLRKPDDLQFEIYHVPRNPMPRAIGDRAPRSSSFLNGYGIAE